MRSDLAATRRTIVLGGAAAAAGCLLPGRSGAESPLPFKQAQVAITLDLEMSRNFPKWEDTHWDFEKGNLNEEAKRYTVEACRRVKAAGGVVHCFAVGRVLEQADAKWLENIAADGHPVGNHTYDHGNVLATKLEDIQYRFQRAPWLVEGQQPDRVIRENIRLTNLALKQRCGIEVQGFRTPGGFSEGLAGRADVQTMLQELGFTWVSSKYPKHPLGDPGREPTADVYAGIVAAQAEAQPFAYAGGLVEVPMSPISDISAFRGGRWKLDWFLKAVRLAVEWSIDQHALFDFLGHPSCLYVVDPEFRTIDLICELVAKSNRSATLTDLGTIARGAPNK